MVPASCDVSPDRFTIGAKAYGRVGGGTARAWQRGTATRTTTSAESGDAAAHSGLGYFRQKKPIAHRAQVLLVIRGHDHAPPAICGPHVQRTEAPRVSNRVGNGQLL